MSQNLALWSATALLEGYRRRQISPVEATQAVLAQIERLNGQINALCLVDRDAALAAARASEARWQRGTPLGLVDGVPATVKDLLLAKGWPTLRGSKTIDPHQAWDEDAPAVARLREQGAILIGKTTTAEFGWKAVGDCPLTGITRNPWNLGHTPGGSSAGAAAATAAGLGALAIGTDGAGSIRIPAAFTGLFGIKATFGRVPAFPPTAFGTVSHVGPMTRSVADGALMLTVLAGGDWRDVYALPPDPRRDYRDSLDDGVAGLRIGYSADLGYARVDPEVARAVADAVAVLAELGAVVEAVDPGFASPRDAAVVLWSSPAAKVVDDIEAVKRSLLDPGLLAMAEIGRGFSATDYVAADQTRTGVSQAMARFHQRFDLLVTPAVPIPALPVGQDTPDGAAGLWVDWAPFGYPFNLTRQPAASVPCGVTAAGLPIGLQLVGRLYDEPTVLRAARAFERARPFPLCPMATA